MPVDRIDTIFKVLDEPKPQNLTPVPEPTILHHGTTRDRARSIAANGPDVHFIEPGGRDEAEGFSAQFTDGRPCETGMAADVARRKARLFPDEGGPAVLEVAVPNWILEILLADPFMEAFALSGEARFEPGFGLEELCREWANIPKRVIDL